MSKPLILIVEDEPGIADTLQYALRTDGFEPAWCASAEAALAAIGSRTPALVILDVGLPDMNGFELFKRLRERIDVPVVFLTARGDEIDRVVGFEVGADDYIVKPFSVRELILRVRAVLRRLQRNDTEPPVVVFGRLRVDHEAHRVWVDEAEISLTALEFRLLHAFVARKGRVQTRDTLLSDVWGIDAEVTTRTVDTHVKRLRDKLGTAGEIIETVRGLGYRIRQPGD
jgi:two-component system phosphate regulon response regulator PhoB